MKNGCRHECSRRSGRRSFHFELGRRELSEESLAAQRPSPRHLRASPVGRFDDEVNTCSSPTPRFGAGSVQFSTYRRTFAVEFSKTGAASERTAQKKPPTRARRPPRVRIVALRVGPGGSYGRVTRVFQRRPCGRPKKYSDSAYPVKRAKRRLPTWSSAPARAARPTSRPAAGSPFTLTRALLDQPPRLGGRRDAEPVDEERRQVDGIAVGQRARPARPRAPRGAARRG